MSRVGGGIVVAVEGVEVGDTPAVCPPANRITDEQDLPALTVVITVEEEEEDSV